MVSIDDRLAAFRRAYNGVLAHDVGPDDTDMTFDPPAFDESFRSSSYVARIECILPGEEYFELIWNGPDGIQRGKGGTPSREWTEGTAVKIIGVAAPYQTSESPIPVPVIDTSAGAPVERLTLHPQIVYAPSEPPTPEEAAIDEKVRKLR